MPRKNYPHSLINDKRKNFMHANRRYPRLRFTVIFIRNGELEKWLSDGERNAEKIYVCCAALNDIELREVHKSKK